MIVACLCLAAGVDAFAFLNTSQLKCCQLFDAFDSNSNSHCVKKVMSCANRHWIAFKLRLIRFIYFLQNFYYNAQFLNSRLVCFALERAQLKGITKKTVSRKIN